MDSSRNLIISSGIGIYHFAQPAEKVKSLLRRVISAAALASVVAVLTATSAYADSGNFDGTTSQPANYVVTPDLAAPVPNPSAGPHTFACPPEYSYTHSGNQTIFMDVKKNYGGRGVALSISVAIGVTVQAQISGSVAFEASAVIASAKTTYGLAFSASMTTTATFGGSWTVPTNVAEGWIAIGARANSTSWKKYQQMGNCTDKLIGSGTDKLPWKFPYFHHS